MAESTLPVSENELKLWIAQSVAEALQEKADELFTQKIAAFVSENERRARELALMERVVRVEEELKALREIQIAHFGAAEKRFEAIDKRFEAMDKRFEAMETRFEVMGTRFEALQREIVARFEAVDKRFETLQREMAARFETADKRFETLQREMVARFEAVDKRFEAMDKRFNMLQWTMGLGFSIIVAFLSILKVWS